MKGSERIILEQLAEHKWLGRYCCARCGNDSYSPGKKDLSRRCKQCKYEESLIKFTAFEGIKFPLIKAYNILQRIVESAYIDVEDEIVPIGKLKDREADDRKYISLIDYAVRCKAKGIDSNTVDERLYKIKDKQRPSLRQLSLEFELEENTIAKFIQKINARITLDEVLLKDSPYQRIIDLINLNHDKELDFYLQMMMMPLVGKWDLGWQRRGKHHLGITWEEGKSWSVYQIEFTSLEDGYFICPFKRIRRIEYGSKLWKMLFCPDIDRSQYTV